MRLEGYMAVRPTPADIKQIKKLVDKIKPILHGEGGLIQGSALAELVGIYVAGWLPEHQDKVIEAHLAAVREYAAIYREVMERL